MKLQHMMFKQHCTDKQRTKPGKQTTNKNKKDNITQWLIPVKALSILGSQTLPVNLSIPSTITRFSYGIRTAYS